MRRLPALVLACALSAAVFSPVVAVADPATLRWLDAEGAVRTARMDTAALDPCRPLDEAPDAVRGPAQLLIDGRTAGTFTIVHASPPVFIIEDRTCQSNPAMAAIITSGRTAPSARLAWLVLIGMIGSIIVAVGLVALFNLGRGPDPVIGSDPDAHH